MSVHRLPYIYLSPYRTILYFGHVFGNEGRHDTYPQFPWSPLGLCGLLSREDRLALLKQARLKILSLTGVSRKLCNYFS